MKVFISYAREDIETAQKLRDDLEKAGVRTWLDKEDLVPGQDWKLAIREAMKKSDFLLILLSSQSLHKRGYVQKEMRMALDMLGEFPKNKIFVIPARADACEPQDEDLLNLHWADLFPSYEKGLHKIIKALGPLPPTIPSDKTPSDCIGCCIVAFISIIVIAFIFLRGIPSPHVFSEKNIKIRSKSITVSSEKAVGKTFKLEKGDNDQWRPSKYSFPISFMEKLC